MLNNILSDVGLIIYTLIILSTAFSGGMFVWWWVKIRHASEVYIYITFLMFAVCYTNVFNFIARYSYIAYPGTDAFEAVLNHPAWGVRGTPTVIIVCLIIVRMMQRIVRVRTVDSISVADKAAHDAIERLAITFDIVCEEIRVSLVLAKVAFREHDVEVGCVRAMEVYAGSKKLEKAIETFCQTVDCEKPMA
jgi:hypothetical protein